jgi:hypothetical protein
MLETIDGPYEWVERSFFLLLIDAVKFAYMASLSDIEERVERSFCRSSILSSVILIESLSNILIETLPWGALRNDLDKLPFLSKVDVYLLSKGKSPLDRGRKEIQAISELKSIRDAFVHPKKKTRQGERQPSEEGVSFNFSFGNYPVTAISNSPSSWSAKDAQSAVGSAITFVRYLLLDVLELSTDDAYKLITSEVRFGEHVGVMSETELKETIRCASALKMDIAFLVPTSILEPKQ